MNLLLLTTLERKRYQLKSINENAHFIILRFAAEQ